MLRRRVAKALSEDTIQQFLTSLHVLGVVAALMVGSNVRLLSTLPINSDGNVDDITVILLIISSMASLYVIWDSTLRAYLCSRWVTLSNELKMQWISETADGSWIKVFFLSIITFALALVCAHFEDLSYSWSKFVIVCVVVLSLPFGIRKIYVLYQLHNMIFVERQTSRKEDKIIKELSSSSHTDHTAAAQQRNKNILPTEEEAKAASTPSAVYHERGGRSSPSARSSHSRRSGAAARLSHEECTSVSTFTMITRPPRPPRSLAHSPPSPPSNTGASQTSITFVTVQQGSVGGGGSREASNSSEGGSGNSSGEPSNSSEDGGGGISRSGASAEGSRSEELLLLGEPSTITCPTSRVRRRE